jgi:uncharacterized Zn finger protein
MDELFVKEITCPDCGHTGEPEITESYEQDDWDGNRGIWLTFIECENCGTDLKGAIDDD